MLLLESSLLSRIAEEALLILLVPVYGIRPQDYAPPSDADAIHHPYLQHKKIVLMSVVFPKTVTLLSKKPVVLLKRHLVTLHRVAAYMQNVYHRQGKAIASLILNQEVGTAIDDHCFKKASSHNKGPFP
jgi:hypothetical protein